MRLRMKLLQSASWGAVLLLAACGRLQFEPREAGPDGRGLDASVDAAVPAGLVAWFPLEDSDGMFSERVAGNNGSCVGSGCPVSVPGRVGNGQLFVNAQAQCIKVPHTAALNLPQLTISLWAFQSVSGNLSLIAKPFGADFANSWQIETGIATTTDSVSFTTAKDAVSNDYTVTPNDVIQLNQWQHIAVTRDATMARLYVNGTERASTALLAQPLDDGGTLAIGCDINGNGDALYYTGILDEVRIYNRALSPQSIAALAAP